MIRTHLFSFFVIVCFLILALASAPSKNSLTTKSGQIPPDFQGYNQTLLILEQSRDWTKYAEKYFEANYTGNFTICSQNELKLKYSDINKYRFILTRNSFRNTDASGSTQSLSQNLCIFDRKTEKTYCTKGSTSFYGKLLKAYSKALETARQNENLK